jgi:hypothetical protein
MSAQRSLSAGIDTCSGEREHAISFTQPAKGTH